MDNIFYKSTTYLLEMMESLLEANIHLHGEHNIDVDSPTLFVANHFTRFETFVTPYVIHAHSKMVVRSLADESIFVGYFEKFLDSIGTLSTTDKHRNEIILGDLMTGRNSWIIYPEGSMIKNKKITKDKEFILHTDSREGSVRTGSAVLAMQAELLKQEFKEAQKAGDILKVREMREKYYIDPTERVSYRSTIIIPVNITYVPIRPGENAFMGIGKRFVEKMNARIKEELEIEGNILLNSEIHITFDKPINISQYLYHIQSKMQDISSEHIRESMISSYTRHELTTLFMDAVYKNILVNFDHIFTLVLEHYAEEFIGANELKRAIFLAARDVVGLGTYNVHHSITDELYKLLTDEEDPWYESSVTLALEQKVLIQVDDTLYKINRTAFEDEHDFHTIRLKNTLRVILNEVSLYSNIAQSVKDNLCKSSHEIKKEVFYVIYNRDQKNYKHDYNHFYSVIFSKPVEIGAPFVLYNPDYTTGVVLSHGYKSSPSEIKELANYLHERGVNVYGVRLKGHGTVSEDLRDTTWEEWYDSFNRGFAAMRQVSKKLFVMGFSTGGLLAILATARKLNKIDGLVVINAALELQDIRVNYLVPTVNRMNDFLSLFNADLEYVETEAEFPEFNYIKNYINSLDQLRLLMEECKTVLSSVNVPTLIVQGDHDPVVKPESAKNIYEQISSKEKELAMFEFSRHVIVLGEGNTKVFASVHAFIKQVLGKK